MNIFNPDVTDRPERDMEQMSDRGTCEPEQIRLLVCGDSHSRYFAPNPFNEADKAKRFAALDVVWAPGASMTGITRGSSTLNLQAKLLERIATYKPDRVVFSLGQVDAEVIYYHALMKGETAEFVDWYALRCRAYTDYLSRLPVKVIVKGPNPSTLSSPERIWVCVRRRTGTAFDNRKRFRRSLHAISAEFDPIEHAMRNELAASLMREACHLEGLTYFDIREHLNDPDWPGMAQRPFIPASVDVHLTDNLQLRDWHFDALFAQL